MGIQLRSRPSGGFAVGLWSALGITSMILWCKLMGHTSGFYLPLVGLGVWANARVFWLVGMGLAALACLALPRTMHRMDPVQRFVMPLIAMMGATVFALAFRQDFFDQKLFAMVGVVVSGFGYFWFISRFVLLLALTQGIASLAWAFTGAFVLRQVLLIAMDAFMAVDHQVTLAIVLPLAAIGFFALACRRARRDAPAGADTLWGIPLAPEVERVEGRSSRYLLVMVVAVGLLLSVARACSISGTWGSDHTAGLDAATAVPMVALYAGLICILVYLGIVRMVGDQDLTRFLVGIFLVMTGLLVSAFKGSLPWVPAPLLEVVSTTNDPFALVFFWTTVGFALQRLAIAPNRVIGIAGTVYALASIAWVFLINNENAVSGAFVLTAVYVLFALFIVVFRLKERDLEYLRAEVGAPSADPGEGEGEALVVALRERCDAIVQQYALSPREADVLVLLAQGRTGSAICEELGVAASTVKTHTQHIYSKLEVGDRQQLMDCVLGLR